jgi:hypothetical protein
MDSGLAPSARPGMTGSIAVRFTPDSIVKQPSVIARIICDAGCVVSLFRLPRKTRGWSAPDLGSSRDRHI